MRYLLDTHVLLWLLGTPHRVAAHVRAKLSDPGNAVWLSVASAWEMEIKRALGKLDTPDDLAARLEATRVAELPIRLAHVRVLATLPPLHRDPFDRMLVAQAKAEDAVLVTADPLVLAYPVQTLAATAPG